jgi:hypothetical protein
MQKKTFLIVLLFLPILVSAQQEPSPSEPQVLDKLFLLIKNSAKKTKLNRKSLTENMKVQYHNTHKSLNTIDHRFDIEANAGVNYFLDFDPKFTPFDTGRLGRETNYGSTIWGVGHVGSTRIPQLGFHVGLVFSFQITRAFKLESGLRYMSKREKYIMNNDTAERNMVNAFNIKHQIPLDLNKEISHNEHTFELPVYLGFTIRRFSILSGAIIKLFSIKNSRTIFIDNTEHKSHHIVYPFKEGYRMSDYIRPTVKLKYLVNKKKIPVSVYLSSEMYDKQEWDFEAGLQVGFFSL